MEMAGPPCGDHLTVAQMADVGSGRVLFSLSLTNFTDIGLSIDSIRFATHNPKLSGLTHNIPFCANEAAKDWLYRSLHPSKRIALVVDPHELRLGVRAAAARITCAYLRVRGLQCTHAGRGAMQIVSWSEEDARKRL